MKNYYFIFKSTFLLLLILKLQTFATFSICAVDTVTEEVGSAGASCIAGSIMLSDPHPGVGVIHSQAYWNQSNQNLASGYMDDGDSPEQIVDKIVANDVQNNPSIRQYGVVDLVDNGRSAAYTGSGTSDYKGHILGKNYSIQGNILLGKEILDSIESRFNETQGTLADKLMAGLQGAKVIGADTRCDQYNKSTISAFLRVAKKDDNANDMYLDLNVDNTSGSTDPIDVLQQDYDDWLATDIKSPYNSGNFNTVILSRNYPNPFSHTTFIQYNLTEQARIVLKVYTTSGREIITLVNKNQSPANYKVTWDGRDNIGNTVIGGVYIIKLNTGSYTETRKVLLVR